MRILVVEHDTEICQSIAAMLQEEGFRVQTDDGDDAMDMGKLYEHDAIVLGDLGGPDGHHVLKHWRTAKVRAPVVMLSKFAGPEYAVRALGLGADDYMTKPYRLPEVAARIRALIRRSNAVADACLSHDGLRLDTRSRTATLNDEPLELTNREWAILELLLMASPAVVSKDRLVQSLAGWDKDITPNAIEVHVSRLRHKLATGTIVIRTVRGIGYRVDAPQN